MTSQQTITKADVTVQFSNLRHSMQKFQEAWERASEEYNKRMQYIKKNYIGDARSAEMIKAREKLTQQYGVAIEVAKSGTGVALSHLSDYLDKIQLEPVTAEAQSVLSAFLLRGATNLSQAELQAADDLYGNNKQVHKVLISLGLEVKTNPASANFEGEESAAPMDYNYVRGLLDDLKATTECYILAAQNGRPCASDIASALRIRSFEEKTQTTKAAFVEYMS